MHEVSWAILRLTNLALAIFLVLKLRKRHSAPLAGISLVIIAMIVALLELKYPELNVVTIYAIHFALMGLGLSAWRVIDTYKE